MNIKESSEAAHIELHDARLDSILLSGDGGAALDFKHLVVYRKVAADRFDVWSYRARLLVRELKRFEVNGALREDDYISDGQILDGDGDEIEPVSCVRRRPADHVRIVFGSGTTLVIDCGSILIELTHALKKTDEWLGPL
jgi:hypothetical protein